MVINVTNFKSTMYMNFQVFSIVSHFFLCVISDIGLTMFKKMVKENKKGRG